MRFSTFLSTEWEFLHAVFTTMRCFYYKNRGWERAGSQVSKTLSAPEVLLMHSGTPETGQKSRFFDLFSPRKRYKLSQILFSVLWSAPQTNSSTEEAITSQSSTLPVAFHSVFFANFAKNRVFSCKMCFKKVSNGLSGCRYIM